MSLVNYRRDPVGMDHIIKRQTRGLVDQAAANVAAGVAVDAEVVVNHYTTDRAAASVTIRHPAALAWQAKNGVLTRAASAAGLEVRARG